MDVISSVQACLEKWSTGGESECRAIVASPHCNPADTNCADVLSTAYQTLIYSTLTSHSPLFSLNTSSLVNFVETVLKELPSSASSVKSYNAILFGELLVDLIWAIDSELEEVLIDLKAIISSGNNPTSTNDSVKQEAIAKAIKTRELVDKDRSTLSEILRGLVLANVLDLKTCRERLENALLAGAGFLPDKVIFDKKEIRARTALFYKQNKFNLLREQSEGYSKLTADLVASLGPSHATTTGKPVESVDSLQARARSAWERVVVLIGYFDLDPNRALDIILDIFSTNIVTHHEFFLALLSYSPWSGDYQRQEQQHPEDDMVVDERVYDYQGKGFDEILRMYEATQPISTAESCDSLKPKVIQQLLGFKYKHYQSLEVQEQCPKSLYFTTALLIREGFVALEDIYPHLYPEDDAMPALHKKYLDSMQTRVSASANTLLAMAAPLESGPSSKTKATATSTEAKKPVEPTKEVHNQKALLVMALLSVGALRPALAVLSKFPWLVDLHLEIADMMIQTMKASLEPVYRAQCKPKEFDTSFSQPRARYTTGGLVSLPPRKSQLTLCNPTPPCTYTTDFVYFYPRWVERVPLCRSQEDVECVLEPFLRFVGLHIHRSPLFLGKLLRVAKSYVSSTIPASEDDTKTILISELDRPTQRFWLQIIRRYIFPALSMLPGNAVSVVDVWNLLKLFDPAVRWRLYGEWRDVTYGTHPELKVQKVLRERETKGILRRLSSDTIDALSGTLAKLTHSNPCIFFTHAVNQIQAYENLADVVILALRYTTHMSMDILVFIILDALANPSKDRVKDDGVYTSDWLQSLSTFTGSFCRRYSGDLPSVLQYIVHQLYNGQTSEIVVLEKLILKMAGIEPLPSLSDTQIAAMAGGPTLRTEALASDLRGAAFNWETATYRSTVRLGKALIETKLAFPLLAQVAQQRQACVFKAKDAHLKSIAFLFDATHGVLFQYLELLTTTSAISLEDYRAIIPPLKDMVQTYGVPLPIAMHVLRPIFNVAIAVRAKQWHSEKAAVKAETSEAAEKRLKAALAAKREPSAPANGSAEGTANGLSATVESTNGTPTINGQMDLDDSKSAAEKDSHMDSISEIPWIPELYELFEDFKAVAPGNVFDVLGPGFYLSFWQMSNYDLYYPKSRYEEMDKALHSASEALYQKFKSADRSPDRSIRKMALNHKNQRQRYLDVIAELSKEKQTQDLVYKFTNDEGGRFDREKAHWFAHANRINRVLTIVSSLIEHCIQPRCLLSPMDADFCSRFVKMLHLRGTPGFPTLMLYDRILSEQVKVVVFSCSENEARNYGRFLRGVLSDLSQWYMSEKAYDAGQRHKSGSKTLISPGFCKRWIKEGTPTQEDLLSYGDFKFFVRKCHRKLGRSLTESIEAREFMHVYNAIIVLKEIIQVFPDGAINDVTGPSLNNTIQALVQTEERGDLKILARAYASSLKKRESTWLGPRTARSASKAPTTTSSTSTTASHGLHTGTSNQETNTQGTSRPDKAHNIPSGPRASLPGAGDGHGLAASDRSMSTRRALENIPRPEVVKRVRTGSKPPDDASARLEVPDRNANALSTMKDLDPKDGKAKPTAIPSTEKPPPGQNAQRASSGHTSAAELRRNDLGTVPNRLRSPPQATASHPSKDTQPHLRPPDSNDVMPPPSAPSQTASAHEIRSTARQAGQSQEAKLQAAAVAEERHSPQASSPAISRPPSPGSRPGTRNASVDSRTSGPSNRKSDRDVDSQEEKKPSRSEKSERTGGHRDVLHGRSERNGRDRSSAKESSRANDRDKSDRDRDKTRDREKDRDREHRDRDRESRDKGRARERERDRDKDRDRDRDRDRGDRHRRDSTRDDKDRDREQRPERNSVSRAQPAPGDEAAGPTLPNRPEAPKHRAPDHSGGDELGGKRRRTAEEDADRGSKRSSRRDEHREDRSRRHADKEGREHGKEDRRRKEREDEAEPKSAHEKTSDRSIARSVAPPPSAPRAMASTQSPRTTRNEALGHREREWTTAREARESTAQSPINGHSPSLPAPPVSLRARIGEKEFPLPHSTMNPTGSQRQGFDRRQGFGEDGQSDSKKRTMSDRDKDRDRDSANANGDSNMQPPKRPRINRNRYAEGSGFARRVLPIDPQAGDRSDHP